MRRIKIVFGIFFGIIFIIINTWSIGQIVKSQKTEVKGITTNTKIVSPTITPTATITPTKIPISIKPPATIQPSQTKYQYGAWYWRPELNKSQVWIGTDSAGKDMWTDGTPTPTITSSPLPQKVSNEKINTSNDSIDETIRSIMVTEKKVPKL